MASQRIPNRDIEKQAQTALKKWVKQLFTVRDLKKHLPGKSRKKNGTLEVDLTVCSSSKMVQINRLHRGKAKPTDVLSFPSDPFFWEQGWIGELVLCGPVVIQQAREMEHSWKHEVDVLIVHGLLHLLGFDHERGVKAALEMAKMEEKLLARQKRKSGLISRTQS